MVLKIINEDGVAHSTRMIDSKTGNDVSRMVPLSSVIIEIDSRDVVRARAVVEMMRLDVVPGVVEWHVPGHGAVRAIETTEGDRIEFHKDREPTIIIADPEKAKRNPEAARAPAPDGCIPTDHQAIVRARKRLHRDDEAYRDAREMAMRKAAEGITLSLMEIEALAATIRIRRLMDTLRRVVIGGNHIVLLLGADHPSFTADRATALAHYGQGADYETWCAYKTILEARVVLEEFEAEDGGR